MPLGGLYIRCSTRAHDRVLVLACDLPFVTAALLQRLAAVESGTSEVDAVVPRIGARAGAVVRRSTTGGAAAARGADRARRAGGWRRSLADLRVRELGPDALAPYDDGIAVRERQHAA